MKAVNPGRRGAVRRCAAAVVLLSTFFLSAQPLAAEEEGATALEEKKVTIAEEEVVTAFEILESHLQSRAIPLETHYRGIAAFGVVAGIGATAGLVWAGLLPAIYGWDPLAYESEQYGLVFGLLAGGAAQLTATSIGHLAFPYSDMRAVYSSILDIADDGEREAAALSALKGFRDRSYKRRVLAGFVSLAAIAAPIVGSMWGHRLADKAGLYRDNAVDFAIGTATALILSLNYLIDKDAQAHLYQRYPEVRP